MVGIGYFLSCEEFEPKELVRQAKMAADAGFERLWVWRPSPSVERRPGSEPVRVVGSVIGALSEAVGLPVTTAVTCPTIRLHHPVPIYVSYRTWPNSQLPGELSQVLPQPRHFVQVAELVTRDSMAGTLSCGPDPEAYQRALRSYVDAGFDEVYEAQIGPRQERFFEFWQRRVHP
jgi:hypothetical protein